MIFQISSELPISRKIIVESEPPNVIKICTCSRIKWLLISPAVSQQIVATVKGAAAKDLTLFLIVSLELQIPMCMWSRDEGESLNIPTI